jgi:alcohol dehydrogenase class IV
VTADVLSAKLEWESAYRALADAAQDPSREDDLRRQLEAVTSELRRRLGGTFTLGELASEYVRADVWARDALAEAEIPGWPRTLSLVEGAAFHLYARGAMDYAP